MNIEQINKCLRFEVQHGDYRFLFRGFSVFQTSPEIQGIILGIPSHAHLPARVLVCVVGGGYCGEFNSQVEWSAAPEFQKEVLKRRHSKRILDFLQSEVQLALRHIEELASKE